MDKGNALVIYNKIFHYIFHQKVFVVEIIQKWHRDLYDKFFTKPFGQYIKKSLHFRVIESSIDYFFQEKN